MFLSAMRRRHSGIARRWLLTPLQALCLAPIAALHFLVVYRVCVVSYGWPALLFSPGLAWYMPLAALLLAAHWGRLSRLPAAGSVKVKGT